MSCAPARKALPHKALPRKGSPGQGAWDAVTLGRIEPRWARFRIAPPLPGGRIAEVLVKPNEEVFAGELLARLDDEEALARVAEAEAQVALHKRARNDQSAPAASADRRKAEDAAADAERAVADTRAALDRAAADWRAGRVARADLDAARNALSRGEDRLRERREALVKLRASADTPLPTRLEGELNVAQAEWRVAQAAFEKTQVRAPADGVVLRVDAKAGELAVPAAGPPIMSIGDVAALRVRAEVNEQDLGRIRLGQAVLVRAGAFHGREFNGRVSSIARVVGPSRINSGDPRKFSDVDVLEVLIELPIPDRSWSASRSTSISGRIARNRSRRNSARHWMKAVTGKPMYHTRVFHWSYLSAGSMAKGYRIPGRRPR